jgi:gas vesicle protein
MAGSFDTMTSGNDRSFGGTDSGNNENETEVLAADIRITQERLGDTVEEIGERFNPSRLKEELKHDIRDATIGRVENMAQQTAEIVSDAQRTIMQSIRENPIPVAMVGIGLGWLILNGRGGQKQMRSGSRYDEQQQRSWGTMYEDQQHGGYNQQQPGTLDRARAKASEVVGSVKHRTSELAEQTQRTAGRVAESAQDVAGLVAEETRMQSRRVERAYQENPLVIGAAALALGLAAGLAIPPTEKEVELVGDTRDHLVDKVRDVAEDTKAKVEQVAGRVMNEAQSTAKDAAQQAGLMS